MGRYALRQDINIEGYWKVIILYNIWLGERDTGFTYTDFDKRRSIVGISPTTSKEQFFNTLIHEIKHVQSHICKYYNVEEDSEAAAYLTGFIMQKMHRCFRHLIT